MSIISNEFIGCSLVKKSIVSSSDGERKWPELWLVKVACVWQQFRILQEMLGRIDLRILLNADPVKHTLHSETYTRLYDIFAWSGTLGEAQQLPHTPCREQVRITAAIAVCYNFRHYSKNTRRECASPTSETTLNYPIMAIMWALWHDELGQKC